MTMFPVLFAIPRTSGWISQWEEMLLDPEQKIARPRQIYLGYDTRHYVPIEQRQGPEAHSAQPTAKRP
jgi:citrate synthase